MNFIIGFHNINTLLKKQHHNIHKVLVDKIRQDKRITETLDLCDQYGILYEFVDKTTLNNYSNKNQGIIALLKQPFSLQLSLQQMLDMVKSKDKSIILILDGVTDPQNLGAIIRTAECFGVDAIILPKNNSANTMSQVVASASAGALFNLPIVYVANLATAIAKLKEHEFWVAGTTLAKNSIPIYDLKCTPKFAWILGSEGRGIKKIITDNCDYLVTIPMYGTTQSLNVSVTTGIVLAYLRSLEHKG